MKSLYFKARRKICYFHNDIRGVVHWTNLLASQNILTKLNQYFDPNIPPAILLEINTDCNYKCPFCPQSQKPRSTRYMTMDAFQHLIVELKSLDYSNEICLSVNNEAFLHPLVIDFCRLISMELPKANTCIISNGSLITIQHLIDFSQLEHPPHITVNDYTPTQRVRRRLSGVLAQRALSQLPIDLVSRSWQESLSNRAGNFQKPCTFLDDCYDITCSWPFIGMFLNTSLEVFLCCSDYSYQTHFGDVNEQGLMDIWRGGELQKVRDALLIPDRRQIALCSKCDAMKLNWPTQGQQMQRDEGGR